MRASGFMAVFAIVPALLFAQIPEYMQQYYQRIGGAVDELDRIVQHFDEDSRRSESVLKLMLIVRCDARGA
jgi:hypothetical protein